MAISDSDGARAEEEMQSHLVDLHSALNLNELLALEQDLRSMLLGHAERLKHKKMLVMPKAEPL